MNGFILKLVVALCVGLVSKYPFHRVLDVFWDSASKWWKIFQASAEVIHLTEETFATHVNGESNILVEFYAPW